VCGGVCVYIIQILKMQIKVLKSLIFVKKKKT